MAHDAAGNDSTLSATATVTTPASPAPPTGTALLTWSKTQESDLDHYNVYYGNLSRSYTTVINVGLTATPDNPEKTVTELPPGTYYFSVTAVDILGNESGYSSEGMKVITE